MSGGVGVQLTGTNFLSIAALDARFGLLRWGLGLLKGPSQPKQRGNGAGVDREAAVLTFKVNACRSTAQEQ